MSNIERHGKVEVDTRVNECYRLRYEQSESITQIKWVEYCHEVYGDRSEQQYCAYWSKAKEKYDEGWKERLNKLLGPATDELYTLLASDDERAARHPRAGEAGGGAAAAVAAAAGAGGGRQRPGLGAAGSAGR